MAALKRNSIFVFAAVVTGLISIIFGLGMVRVSLIFRQITAAWPWLVFALCPVGFAVVVFLTRKVFPGAQGSGIPQAPAVLKMRDVADIDSVLSLRIAVGKFLPTLLGFLVSASIGKEGPTVQIRCAAMNICSRTGLQRTHALQRVLILAGGAAGIACAFNVPIAGIVYLTWK